MFANKLINIEYMINIFNTTTATDIFASNSSIGLAANGYKLMSLILTTPLDRNKLPVRTLYPAPVPNLNTATTHK